LACLLKDDINLKQRSKEQENARLLTARTLAPPPPPQTTTTTTTSSSSTNNQQQQQNTISPRLLPLNLALRDGIPVGIGVHNADLTTGEREVVEAAVNIIYIFFFFLNKHSSIYSFQKGFYIHWLPLQH